MAQSQTLSNLEILIRLRDEASKEISKVTSSVNKGLKGLDSTLGSASRSAFKFASVGLAGIATGFGAVVTAGAKTAGELESAKQGFVALLGSAEKANATMNRIKQEAKATPFELQGLVAGTQALTAITKDGDQAVDILLDVGKAIATSGKGQAELDRVILNLQQISATGKVTAMDIKQFQGAIPMFNDIMEASGLTAEELQNSSNSAELLFDAFKKAGAEGGITAQGFTAQAGTFNQVLSNLKDSWGIFLSDFVQNTGIFDLVKSAISGLTSFIESKQDSIIRFGAVVGNVLRSIAGLLTGGVYDASELEEALTFFTNDDWEKASEIRQKIENVVNALKSFAEWVVEHKETIFAFLKGLAIAFGALAVIGMLVNALANPLVWIAGLVALLYTAWSTNFGGIQDKTKAVLDWIREFWDKWGQGIMNMLEGWWKIIKGIFELGWAILKGQIQFFTALFRGDFEGAWEAVKGIFDAGSRAVVTIFEGLVQVITGLLQTMFNSFKDKFEEIWNTAQEYANKIRDAIRKAFDKDEKNSPSIMETISDTVLNVNKAIQGFGSPVPLAHTSGFQNFVGSLATPSGGSNTYDNRNQSKNISLTAVINNPLDVDEMISKLNYGMAYNYD